MRNIPPVTRYLILTNVVVFLIQKLFEARGIDLADIFGLHFILAGAFSPLQLVTYMFLHGGFTHLFFNMFSLWMFGGLIERTLGAKRFAAYYFITGVGAGLCQELFQTGQYFVEGLAAYDNVDTGASLMPMGDFLNLWTTIGASGACYGVLLAFGMLYPNERLMLLFPPLPMKAKYFVAGYAVIELVSAFASNGNIAHFAHLGGMFFGWLLLRHWHRRAHSRATAGGWERWDDRPRRPSLWQRFLNWAKGIAGKRETTAGNARHAPFRETDHEYNERKKAEEARMDEILDKVRRAGYDSLTPEEKRELFRISRR